MERQRHESDREVKSWRERWKDRKQKRMVKMHDQEQMLHAKIALMRARREYRRVRVGAAFIDWLAVFVAFVSFIFLIAWQEYPEWDPNAIFPTFVRSALVAAPITLGMWGVARALKPGSDVPRSMAAKIPYGKVNADGTIGGTDKAGDDIQPQAPTQDPPQDTSGKEAS